MEIAFAREARIALRDRTNWWDIFKMRFLGKKLLLGYEQRKGWSGALPFYLFWCRFCGQYAKDYPHSFPEKQFLACSFCDARHSFVSWKVKWQMFYAMWKLFIRYRMGRL